MAVLKLSKNDIKKNDENKIKLNKSQLSFDSAMVHGWESTNNDSFTTINNYYDKINKGEYLSADDIATYKSALESFTSTSNRLRGLNKTFGEGYSEEDEKKWTDSLTAMQSDYDNASKYYSSFKTEDAFKSYLESVERENKIKTYNLEAGKVELDKAKDLDKQIKDAKTWMDQAYSTASTAWGGNFVKAATDAKAKYEALQKQWADTYGDTTLEDMTSLHYDAERYQTGMALKNRAITDEDFAEWVKGGVARGLETEFKVATTEHGSLELFSNVTNSMIIAYRENPDLWMDNTNINSGKTYASEALKYAQHMTDEQYQVYCYYFAKDEAKAEEYLKSIEKEINSKEAGRIVEGIGDNGFLKMAFAIGAGLDQFGTGVKNLFSNEDYYAPSAVQIAGSQIREDLGDSDFKILGNTIGQIGYDAFNTFGNMLPSILVSYIPVVGQVAGNLSMGLSAMGNAKAEMINLGYSEAQANTYGALVGASEALLQYALGGISQLGGKTAGGMTQKVLGKVDNAFARVSIKHGKNLLHALASGGAKLGINMASEGLEESLQTILEPWFKSVVMDTDFEAPNIDEVLYSGLLGALSAGALEGISTTAETVQYTSAGKAVQKAGAVDRLAKSGSLFSADSVAYKLAGRVNENTGAYTIGHLLYEMDATLTEQNKSEIAEALQQKGMTKKDANTFAKWLEAAVEGKVFTDKQIDILENNEIVNKVFYEVIAERNSTVNQRTQGYKEALLQLAMEKSGVKKANTDANAVTKTIDGGIAPLSQEEMARRIKNAENGANTTPYHFGEVEYSPETVTAENTAKESVFSYNGEGKTIYKDKEVSVKGIDSIKNGVVSVRLDSGEVVDAKEVSFSSQDEALMYEMVADLGVSADTAMKMKEIFGKGNVDAGLYRADAPLAYKYGRIGYTKGLAGLNLSYDQKTDLFGLGRTDAKNETASMDANRKVGKGKTLKFDGKQTKKNGIIYEGIDPDGISKDVQKASIIAAEMLAKSSNLEIHAYESYKDAKGNIVVNINGEVVPAPNGMFRDGNKIFIDINASSTAKGTMEGAFLYTLSHEVGHYIRQWNAKGFKELADFLFENYKGEYSVDYLIKTEMDLIKKRLTAEDKAIPSEVKLYDMAYEEVVCNAFSKLLADENAYIKLANLKKQNKTLWAKIGEAIKKFLNELKKAIGIYAKYDPSVRNAAMTKDMATDVFNKLQDMYIKAFVEADAVYESLITMEETTESVAVEDTTMFSYRSLAEAAGFTVMENENGTRSFIRDGNAVDKVTVEDIENSPIGAFINYSLEMGDINDEQATRQKELFADICTLACQTNDFSMTMQFVGSAVFTAMKANADKQYGTTYDFPSICTKTQAVIDAMSAKMVKLGRGLKKAEITDIYNEVFNSGNPVPCPECYVFSRWIGIGGLLDNIKQYQERYGNMTVAEVASEYAKMRSMVEVFAKEKGLTIGKAKGALSNSITKEYYKLKEKIEKNTNQGEVVKLSDKERLLALEPMMTTVKAMTWLENVYFQDSSHTKVNKNFKVPDNVLFDLNKGEEFATKYPKTWAFRTNQGAGYGKAITPYAEAVLGEGVLTTNNTSKIIKDKANGKLKNIFLEQNGQMSTEAKKILARARAKQKNQAFLGMQRFQSTSDARYENASDYLLAMLEMQAMGGGVQVYTKVNGAVPAFANWGCFINQSLMPLEGGLDENGELKDTAVGGMSPKAAFKNREQFDTAGTITIGVNDEHIRKLFNDPNRDFAIPYHASGGDATLIAYFRTVQDRAEIKGGKVRSTDYSRTQSDKILSDEVLEWLGKTDAEIEQIHNVRDARIAILTGGKPDMDVVRGNRFLSKLYDKIHGGEWDGVKLAKSKFESQIYPNEYWDESVSYEESGKNTRDYLEYCDSLGFLHRFSGLVPSNGILVGVKGYDKNGNRVTLTDLAYKYDENGQKTDEVEEFYWKSIVDHRMYDNNGNYNHQRAVTLSDTTTDTVTTFAKYNEGRQYDKAKSLETAKKIAESADDTQYSDRETSWRDVEKIQGLEDYSVEEVADIVRTYIENIAMEYGEDIEIIGIRPFGSRARGTAKNTSDLDVVVQYEGDIREDDMFNMLNDVEDKLAIDGIEIDINPIKADDTGTIEEYLDRVYSYDKYRDTQYSDRVTDKETLDFLNEQIERGEYNEKTNPNGGYYVTYKSMSFWGYDENGNAILRSPMAEYVDGKLSGAYLIPKEKGKLNWYAATETIDPKTGFPTGLLVETEVPSKKNPSKMTKTLLPASENQHLIMDDWSNLYFKLKKKIFKDGKWEWSDVPARYNPYEHSSNSMLNDQFTAAWRRDNLVTVKMYVPVSEDNGTYRAKWSKDPTGWTDWKTGIVAGKIGQQKDLKRRLYLSRYAAPVEIVPDSEVAKAYKGYLEGTDVSIPDNVVSPNLLKELKKIGVPIQESGKVDYSDTLYSDRDSESTAKDFVSHMRNLAKTNKAWTDKDVFDYVEAHPHLNFVDRIYENDKQVKKDLETFLGSINDVATLNSFDWFMGGAYKDKNRAFIWSEGRYTYPYRGATTKFRNAIKKRIQEIMEATVQGEDIGFEMREYKLSELREFFERMNSNEDIGKLADKVFDVADLLGLEIRGVRSIDGEARTWGVAYRNEIAYRVPYMNDKAVTNQEKAGTILHELIHSCTTYAIVAVQKNVSIGLTQDMIYAVNSLEMVYDRIKNDADFKNEYGIKNIYEMVAELSNPSFRDKLHKKNLWDYIVDFFKRLFGIKTKEVNALDGVSVALDYMLDSFDSLPYRQYLLSTRGTIFKKEGDVLYSDRDYSDRYSYETLTSKPDMKLTIVGGTVPNNNADIVAVAKKNASAVGKTNKSGNVSVYVDDIGRYVQLGTDGLKHGLRRTKNLQTLPNYIVTLKAGEILKNSIQINELTPSKTSAKGSYVLIGAAKDANGVLYIVRSIVNQFTRELVSIDTLYAINAKKELAATKSPRFTGNPLSVTNSTISIAELLDSVNQFFPDILPESVLRHFGYDARPDGEIGDSALYSERDPNDASNRTLLANALETTIDTSTAEGKLTLAKLNEYKGIVRKIDELEKKRGELIVKANELQRKKGKTEAEMKEMKDLRFEANKLANNISTYDGQLLRIEAMKPIKELLNRETKLAYDRAVQRGRESLNKYREDTAKRTRDIITHYQESRAKAVEGRHKTVVRNQLKNVVADLKRLLERGTKERNVKIGLQETVAKALDLAEVLLSDEYTNEAIARLGVDSVTDAEAQLLETYVALLDRIAPYKQRLEKLYEERKELKRNGAKRSELDDIEVKVEAIRNDAEYLKLSRKISELNSALSDVFIRERNKYNKAKAQDIMDALINAYASLKDSEYDYIQAAYNEELVKRLESIKKTFGNVSVKDMTLQDLQDIYKAYAMVKHVVTDANTIFRDGRKEDLGKRIDKVQAELRKMQKERKDPPAWWNKIMKWIRSFSWQNLRPVDAFERLGVESFKELFWDSVKAQDTYARDIVEAGEVISEARKKYGYKKWDLKTVKTFKTINGLEFKLTLGDMMSIYAYSFRDQAYDHMTQGGFVFDNGTYKEKDGKVTRVRVQTTDTYIVSDALIQEIIAEVEKNKDVASYVKDVQRYLTALGEKGNEVSRILYGIDLFTEEHYFPLQSASDYRSSVEQALNQTQTQVSLKNTGMTKATVPHAKNPIVLRAFDEVVLEHIDKMSKYHAYVIPIENLQKVFNNSGWDANNEPVATKALISGVFGEEAKAYFDQYITDLNGGGTVSGADSPVAKLFGTAKGVAVAANLSVVAQQYFAVVRAMAEIDAKYFVGNASKADGKLYEELKKYAPVAIIKEMGGFDIGSNRGAKDYIGMENAPVDGEYVWKKFQDATMFGASLMDKAGWSTIWTAVKNEIAGTRKDLKVGSEEFLKACGDRFTEVVTRTQVYDSVNTRSGYMRNKRDSVKYLTSFMGEPTASVGMYFTAINNYIRSLASGDKAQIKEAKRRLGGTLVSLPIAGVLTAISKALIQAMRDDDEDESYLEKWLEHYAGNLRDDLIPLNSLPFFRDIMSVIDGWDVERPDMSLIADLITGLKNMFDEDATEDDVLNGLGAIANFFGIPLKNLIKDTRGFINTINSAFNGEKTTGAGLWRSFREGIASKEIGNTQQLYEAYMSDDKEQIKRVEGRYEDKSEIESALRQALRKNDSRIREAAQAVIDGNHAERIRLTREIVAEGHFKQDIVVGAINAELIALKRELKEQNNKK